MSHARILPGVVLLTMLAALNMVRADQVLVAAGEGASQAALTAHNARLLPQGNVLRIETEPNQKEAGFVATAPAGDWNLSAFQDVAVAVKNRGAQPVRVFLRIENPGPERERNYMTQSRVIAPGRQESVRVDLPRRFSRELRSQMTGMRGVPSQISIQPFDLAHVATVAVFVADEPAACQLELGDISACGSAANALVQQEAKFFPLIDEFGQYRHKDWPGKTHSPADLAVRKNAEEDDWAAHPGPSDRNQFGGWQSGPQLPATGFFRTEKIAGKWWLVDPEGKLFWSFAIDSITTYCSLTVVGNRPHWFAALPPHDSPWGQFYGGDRRHSADGRSLETYNFTAANLLRKYGEHWKARFPKIALQRLRSWGFNTVGNNTGAEVYGLRKMPYALKLGAHGRPIVTAKGYWGPFTDVFAPEYPAHVRERLERVCRPLANDPWCIGFYVDNELGWGSDVSLAVDALCCPPDQPAKLAFLDDLQKKYGTIDRLNAVWGSNYASWEAMRRATAAPNRLKAQADLLAFYRRLSERYFSIIRDALRAAAPHHLYLGCRYAGANNTSLRAAAKYCDVVSFNSYKHTLTNLRLPDGCDKPIIIGEFHMGALDRGLFHTGLVGVANQQDRARAFKRYVESGLDSPAVVGAHWFEYGDEAATAWPDGENYQIGFVDVCDTPYPEIIQAAREVGAAMYSRRKGNGL